MKDHQHPLISARGELKELVKGALFLLKARHTKGALIELNEEKIEKAPIASPIETVKVEQKIEPASAASPPSRPTSINTNWELQPMQQPLLTGPHALAGFVPGIGPFIPIVLVLPEESCADRLFLENVSRAITRTFAPATVALYDKDLFAKPEGKIFLIPQPLLKKKYPELSPHQLLKRENFSLLVLEKLELYQENIQAKQALWKAIQHLFPS